MYFSGRRLPANVGDSPLSQSYFGSIKGYD